MKLESNETIPDAVLQQEKDFFGLPVYLHLTHQSAVKIAKLCKIYRFEAGDDETQTFLAHV